MIYLSIADGKLKIAQRDLEAGKIGKKYSS